MGPAEGGTVGKYFKIVHKIIYLISKINQFYGEEFGLRLE